MSNMIEQKPVRTKPNSKRGMIKKVFVFLNMERLNRIHCYNECKT